MRATPCARVPPYASSGRPAWAASLASPPLRTGLNDGSAERAARHLRALLGTAAVALTDTARLLAWDGTGNHLHDAQAVKLAKGSLRLGRTDALGPDQVACGQPDCPVRHVVVTPLTVDDRVVGTLQAYSRETSAGLVRAATEVARWVLINRK